MNIPFLKRKKTYTPPGRSPERVWLISLICFFVILVGQGAFAAYLYFKPQTVEQITQNLSGDAAQATGKKTEQILKEYAFRQNLFDNRKNKNYTLADALGIVEPISTVASSSASSTFSVGGNDKIQSSFNGTMMKDEQKKTEIYTELMQNDPAL